MEVIEAFGYEQAIDEICNQNWEDLSQDDLVDVAWAYYYFSIHFRECLENARKLYPNDHNLEQLEREECNTSNLSPWPGVASAGEKMNHDEFMRRLLQLSPIDAQRRDRLEETGQNFLDMARRTEPATRAMCIASYEDGGLEQVFRAFLRSPQWNDPMLQAFRHFLTEHIKFDTNPEHGHGSLSRHLEPDDRILPVWREFKDLLVKSVPTLRGCL